MNRFDEGQGVHLSLSMLLNFVGRVVLAEIGTVV